MEGGWGGRGIGFNMWGKQLEERGGGRQGQRIQHVGGAAGGKGGGGVRGREFNMGEGELAICSRRKEGGAGAQGSTCGRGSWPAGCRIEGGGRHVGEGADQRQREVGGMGGREGFSVWEKELASRCTGGGGGGGF